MQTKQFEFALSAFQKLRAKFPAPSMNLDLRPTHLDLAMDIPAQPGLSFNVHLDLQNLDELHFKAQLRRPSHGGWENVATWSDVTAIVPWPRKTLKVLQSKSLSEPSQIR